MERLLAYLLDHAFDGILIAIICFLCWMMRVHPPFCRQVNVETIIAPKNPIQQI